MHLMSYSSKVCAFQRAGGARGRRGWGRLAHGDEVIGSRIRGLELLDQLSDFRCNPHGSRIAQIQQILAGEPDTICALHCPVIDAEVGLLSMMLYLRWRCSQDSLRTMSPGLPVGAASRILASNFLFRIKPSLFGP